MKMLRIYTPANLPIRWQDATGALPAAVKAYLCAIPGRTEIRLEQFNLLRDYCEYYINAPCWSTETMESQFAELRERVKTLKSAEEIDAWIDDALAVGIDPL